MIPVRRRSVDVDAKWLERARKALEELDACADDPPVANGAPPSDRKTAQQKRADVLAKRGKVWADLKELLELWSYGKCWYTEAREAVSDYHVDHFRPKSRVAVHPDRPTNGREEGYWWLAFDWRNYRLAGAWANSPHRVEGEELPIGKWDYFPLLNERFKAMAPGDDHEQEQALLLDPVKEVDARLLTFNETGAAIPAVHTGSPTAERVKVSIKILGLDSPKLREERRRKWHEVQSALDEIEEYDDLPDEERSPHWQDEERARLTKLVMLTTPDNEFCGAARACVRALKHDLSDSMAPLDGSILAEPERWKARREAVLARFAKHRSEPPPGQRDRGP